MTSEVQKVNLQSAYQLGWIAFDGDCDEEPFATADEAFVDLVQETGGNVGAIIRAYNCGFDDAMMAAISG